METAIGFLQALPGILGPVLGTLAGLIVLDVTAGIGVALRTGQFQWMRLATFYKTNVLPYGITAIGIAAAAQFISIEYLPVESAEFIADLGTLIGVTPMFLNLIVGSILPNVKALVLGKAKWEILNPGWGEGQGSVTGYDDAAKAFDEVAAANDVPPAGDPITADNPDSPKVAGDL